MTKPTAETFSDTTANGGKTMATTGDAINLYVTTAMKWKNRAEKNVVSQAAVSGGNLYVDGQQVDFESVSPDRFGDGDAVFVAHTEDEGRVVVLG